MAFSPVSPDDADAGAPSAGAPGVSVCAGKERESGSELHNPVHTLIVYTISILSDLLAEAPLHHSRSREAASLPQLSSAQHHGAHRTYKHAGSGGGLHHSPQRPSSVQQVPAAQIGCVQRAAAARRAAWRCHFCYITECSCVVIAGRPAAGPLWSGQERLCSR